MDGGILYVGVNDDGYVVGLKDSRTLLESQEGTFPDACIVTNFSLNENGDIM